MSEKEIRVLYVQPGKYPEERIIPNTLKASQELVGGNIECCYPWRDELAELYNFTQDQKNILRELLSDEMRPTLLALCGGIGIIEDGELCWPLPGHTYISCHFGEVDAFGNAGHRGTDIPAPEGTPILAAHSGTVLVSGWNDSYGNQVLLDNGAGLSTRYAHMTQTAVTAGEAVTAGQIIGYVGSTGDSTGNHLHFEVMQNGVRMNPLELVFAQ